MECLENIIEIKTAMSRQKEREKIFIPKLVKDLFKIEKENIDISSKLMNGVGESLLFKISEEEFEKNGEKSYNIIKQLSDYFSLVKDKLYDYYSAVKASAKETVLGFKTGYTDKLIKEIEDWGTIYYKTVFQNLKRLTPLGWASRYMQKLWICVLKTIKS